MYKCKYFIVATCFGLIKPSSGQHSEIWGTISAYHALQDPIFISLNSIGELVIPVEAVFSERQQLYFVYTV